MSVLMILLVAASVLAQPAPLITARELLDIPAIRNITIAPDSALVVFQLRRLDVDANETHQDLWSISPEAEQPQRLTYSSGNDWDPRFSPTGNCLAFLSDRPDENGTSGTRLWLLPMNGGEACPVTKEDLPIHAYHWAADGSGLYYLTDAHPSEVYRNWQTATFEQGRDATDHGNPYPRREIRFLSRHDCQDILIFRADPGVESFDISSDGEQLVYSTNYTGDPNDWVELDLFHVNLRDTSLHRRLTADIGPEFEPQFSPDGRRVGYLTHQDPRKPFSQQELEVIRVAGGGPRRLSGDLDLGIASFHWRNSTTLYVEVMDGLTNQLYSMDLSGAQHALTAGEAYFYRFSFQNNGPAFAAVRETATSAGEVVLWPEAGRSPIQMTDYSKVLTDFRIHPQDIVRWPSKDGRFNLEGLLVLPENAASRRLPLLVNVHGGPAGRIDVALIQGDLFQAWASHGYAVLSVNFRGSEGYGARFQVANFRDLGGGDFEDIMSGVDHLVRKGIAHPDSLVIMGGSYGGYMTNWAVTQTNRFKAAISEYGIFDLKNDFSNSDYSQWELDYLGGKTYWEDPQLYARMSPSAFIAAARTPTLIIHGDDDHNTFISNSRELHRALKTLDVPHRFVHYPREGHGISEPKHRLDLFQRELAWANKHLGKSPIYSNHALHAAEWRLGYNLLDPAATFHNRPGETFTQIEVILDGSLAASNLVLYANDIQLVDLAGSTVSVAGLASRDLMVPFTGWPQTFPCAEGSITLDLVFPGAYRTGGKLNIKGLGTFLMD